MTIHRIGYTKLCIWFTIGDNDLIFAIQNIGKMKRLLMSNCNPFFIGGIHMQENVIAKSRTSPCKSLNLMLQSGLIAPTGNGLFHLMPMLVRSLEKLTNIIDKKMHQLNCQKVMLSNLGTKQLWQTSGRWESFGAELIKTKIGGVEHCLCPTHEEAVCSVMMNYTKQLSHLHCPMRIYQTTNKFRNEPRPHHGLLRCREFIMNDLYTFDVDKHTALETYSQITNMYSELFAYLGIDVVKAQARSGSIGGDFSHEYHILSEIGEDRIAINETTGDAFSEEYLLVNNINSEGLNHCRGIEVGHTFYLGSRYSEPFNLRYTQDGMSSQTFKMGCFGLGITRILAASVEVLSNDKQMGWPISLAPYKVCVILPKTGSKEYDVSNSLIESLLSKMMLHPELQNDIIFDDRSNRTIGWKLNHAKLMGYPIVLILGKSIMDVENPKLELLLQTGEKSAHMVSIKDVEHTVVNAINC